MTLESSITNLTVSVENLIKVINDLNGITLEPKVNEVKAASTKDAIPATLVKAGPEVPKLDGSTLEVQSCRALKGHTIKGMPYIDENYLASNTVLETPIKNNTPNVLE